MKYKKKLRYCWLIKLGIERERYVKIRWNVVGFHSCQEVIEVKCVYGVATLAMVNEVAFFRIVAEGFVFGLAFLAGG